MFKTIANEYHDWKYLKFLYSNSGTTTVEVYSDLKILVHDHGDKISQEFLETIANENKIPVFVVEVLYQRAIDYNHKTLKI